MNDLIYFDNAATTYPKPHSVISAMAESALYCGGNPGRGSHRLSESASELVYDTRERAAMMFHAQPENVVFTLNATQALNYAIKGLVKHGWRVLIDNYAHNAAYRPAAAIARKGLCSLHIYDASKGDDRTVENVKRLIIPGKTAVIATHQSNISSAVLPIGRIGEVCRKNSCPFIVDASQSAGHIPIDLIKDNITSLCMPGHKGLYGIMGSGMLISSPDAEYETLIEGGAGVASLDETMPEMLPERLEAGTLPLPAIASLNAGMEYVMSVGEEKIHSREMSLAKRFCAGASEIGRIRLHGRCDGSVVGFTVDNKTPAEVGIFLSEHGICVRTGYHCAPLAHKTVGTIDGGSVRVSFSHMNTASEVDETIRVLSLIK